MTTMSEGAVDPADSAARAPDGEHATRGHYVVKTDLRKTNDDALNHVFDSLGLQETLNALAILESIDSAALSGMGGVSDLVRGFHRHGKADASAGGVYDMAERTYSPPVYARTGRITTRSHAKSQARSSTSELDVPGSVSSSQRDSVVDLEDDATAAPSQDRLRNRGRAGAARPQRAGGASSAREERRGRPSKQSSLRSKVLVPPELKLLEDLPPGVKIDVSKLQLEPEDDSDLSAFLIDPRQARQPLWDRDLQLMSDEHTHFAVRRIKDRRQEEVAAKVALREKLKAVADMEDKARLIRMIELNRAAITVQKSWKGYFTRKWFADLVVRSRELRRINAYEQAKREAYLRAMEDAARRERMTIEAFWRKRQRSMYGFFKRTRIVREQMKTSRNVDASDDPHYVTIDGVKVARSALGDPTAQQAPRKDTATRMAKPAALSVISVQIPTQLSTHSQSAHSRSATSASPSPKREGPHSTRSPVRAQRGGMWDLALSSLPVSERTPSTAPATSVGPPLAVSRFGAAAAAPPQAALAAASADAALVLHNLPPAAGAQQAGGGFIPRARGRPTGRQRRAAGPQDPHVLREEPSDSIAGWSTFTSAAQSVDREGDEDGIAGVFGRASWGQNNQRNGAGRRTDAKTAATAEANPPATTAAVESLPESFGRDLEASGTSEGPSGTSPNPTSVSPDAADSHDVLSDGSRRTDPSGAPSVAPVVPAQRGASEDAVKVPVRPLVFGGLGAPTGMASCPPPRVSMDGRPAARGAERPDRARKSVPGMKVIGATSDGGASQLAASAASAADRAFGGPAGAAEVPELPSGEGRASKKAGDASAAPQPPDQAKAVATTSQGGNRPEDRRWGQTRTAGAGEVQERWPATGPWGLGMTPGLTASQLIQEALEGASGGGPSQLERPARKGMGMLQFKSMGRRREAVLGRGLQREVVGGDVPQREAVGGRGLQREASVPVEAIGGRRRRDRSPPRAATLLHSSSLPAMKSSGSGEAAESGNPGEGGVSRFRLPTPPALDAVTLPALSKSRPRESVLSVAPLLPTDAQMEVELHRGPKHSLLQTAPASLGAALGTARRSGHGRHRRTQSVDFDKDSAELILPALLEKMAAVEEGQEAAEGTSPDGVARWGPEEAPWLSVEVSWASEQPVTSAARGARGDKSPGRVPVTGTLLGGVKEVIWRGGHLPHLSPLDRPLANAPLEDSPPGGGGDFAVEKCGGPGAPGVASHVLQARHAPPAGRRFKHLRENPMLDNSFSSSVPLVKNAVHVPLSRAADAPLPAESASRAPLASSHSRLDAHAAVPLRVAAASKRAGGEDADGHAGQPGASRHPPAAERGPIAGPVSIRDSFATEDHRHSGPARPPAAEPSLKGLGGWGSEDMVLEESFQSSAGNAGAESSGLFHGGRAKGRRGLKATPGAAQAERGRVQGLVPGIYFFPPGGERTAGRRRAQVASVGRIGASVGRNKAAGARAEHRALQEMMYLRSRPQVVPDDWVVEGSAAEDWSLEAGIGAFGSQDDTWGAASATETVVSVESGVGEGPSGIRVGGEESGEAGRIVDEQDGHEDAAMRDEGGGEEGLAGDDKDGVEVQRGGEEVGKEGKQEAEGVLEE